MSCRRIMRWVLRHGVAEIPAEWHDHIDGCARCRDFIANINALDTALADSDVPDPGKEYWEAFAPSVARRIEEREQAPQSAPVPQRGWWAWGRRLAPAIGVAVLAVLIGRELSRDYTTKPTVMDRDVPVQTQKAPLAEEPVASGEEQPMIADQESKPDPAEFDADEAAPHENVAGATRQPTPTPTEAEDEGPRLSAQPESIQEQEPTDRSDLPGNVVDELDMATIEEPEIPEMASPRSPEIVKQEDDAAVWPDRRVQTLGQLGQDAQEQPTMDDARLSEQSSPGLANSRSWTSSGAETSSTPSGMARLESRQAFRSASLPDSQSPTEAMRRFDELTGLHKQIAELEALKADERTQEQTRELCAMWYRTGQITLDPAELDRAIQRMEIYIVELDDSLRQEWIDKKSQLVTRRATLDR
ncbi:MAG: hypothetical protein GF341_05570 [candidate division Zixibacteria bacterium]|nr:hypothetical protein [candidate division Zixibacteria bacterium]